MWYILLMTVLVYMHFVLLCIALSDTIYNIVQAVTHLCSHLLFIVKSVHVH